MRHHLLLLLLLLLSLSTQAGTLRGRVTDENGKGLPFASIYIKETASGTGTNDQGLYQLQLSPGTYTLEFKYVGYRAQTETVTIGEGTQELNVQLQPEVLNLKEVVVRAADEDPAYTIMRNAIRLRKYHQNEVNAWSARVYMKSVARMDKVPPKVLGIKVVDVDTGIVYLSESVSELAFKKPNKIHERMISSKVSGQKRGFSFNQASEMNVSFYDNLLKVQGLSERGFVSPLASNALFYYRFEYMGAFEENGRTINKIKVIPRRKNDPVFSGSIYIVDGTWRIHSTDLKLTKDAGIEFVDWIRVRQVYAPVLEHVWMPVQQRFTFEGAGLGFRGGGYAMGVYSKYKVQPAYARPPKLEEVEPEPATETVVAEAKPAKRPTFKLIEPEAAAPAEQPVVSDKLFSKEVLLVEKGSNERDSAYWAEIRPVPLTQQEVVDYQKKDSLEVIKNSKPYQDSLDAVRNVPSFGSFLLGGYTYSNSYARKFYRFDPVVSLTGGPSILQYNTVEGVAADVRVEYLRRFEDRRAYTIEPAVRYGFSNNKLNAKLKMGYHFNPFKNSYVSVEGGRYVQQINNLEPISPFVNTLYTLLAERNYLKLYQRDFGQVSLRSEIVNGINFIGSVNYAHRMPLQNTADFTLKERGKDEASTFTPNVPVNAELADAAFMPHEALILSAALQFRPGLRYMTRPDDKINLGSKYPTFALSYRGAFKAFGGDVQYNTAALSISDEVSFGLLGRSKYNAISGIFWGKEDMRLLDYKHFNGNRTIVAGVYNGFQLLDYYRYSTNNAYVEAHYEHHFNGFLFNKIPLFRKLKWQEVVSLNYLNTQQSGNYLELGLGVEHIFKVFRVDFVTSFQEGNRARTGIMIGFGF
ncbi:DUF5686 and carboxypeptidase regulatory-like domain-containing protein [Pontibacter akesuensis]|uniref:CarboxypepD_reg-like domain-containing protein n=1 Tax=Pontibacter akesuensis TaxID=388950 RepID=A0A1I7IHK5_9BACT|nr:DUF5686 and carboxypeptidase regulatory-like domain-containing protein [Pontibacter akesuensis]GHA67209.1 membrane protein [Pontibacter akesuensis]SFU72401.1 CarboxypepD_reg-like domain-containing protein [Pontibacter akesuensis]